MGVEWSACRPATVGSGKGMAGAVAIFPPVASTPYRLLDLHLHLHLHLTDHPTVHPYFVQVPQYQVRGLVTIGSTPIDRRRADHHDIPEMPILGL